MSTRKYRERRDFRRTNEPSDAGDDDLGSGSDQPTKRLAIPTEDHRLDYSKFQKADAKLKALLGELQLPVFVQTPGSRGLHLFVPLDRQEDFDSVRAFSDRMTGILRVRILS